MSRLLRLTLCSGILALMVGMAAGHSPDDGSKASDLDVKKLSTEPVLYTNLKIGATFEWGAFDLGAQPEGMMITKAILPANNKFVRFQLGYLGIYQDPNNPAYKGYLFSGEVGGKSRFFLFGIDGGNRRLFVYYRDDGKVLGEYTVNVARQ